MEDMYIVVQRMCIVLIIILCTAGLIYAGFEFYDINRAAQVDNTTLWEFSESKASDEAIAILHEHDIIRAILMIALALVLVVSCIRVWEGRSFGLIDRLNDYLQLRANKRENKRSVRKICASCDTTAHCRKYESHCRSKKFRREVASNIELKPINDTIEELLAKYADDKMRGDEYATKI